MNDSRVRKAQWWVLADPTLASGPWAAEYMMYYTLKTGIKGEIKRGVSMRKHTIVGY